ncbi:ribbon-helix-helix protein, CopG family [Streptomyces lycii]|uniref:ribbon-helix-helix protein, CopG family n=1 Tax=Streptomyces lycii TaxID=2654337 RepID=UPI001F1596FE|nr:ribbon-helix-helix protein, CopG family [Streptomyces lycii]
MKRTNVCADPEDLAILKEAARRRGISEAEIIRQGIHLAAMANRVRDEPLFSRTFEGAGRTPVSKRCGMPWPTPYAVNVALAADYDTDAVIALDRRDFRAERLLGRHKAFRVLPDDLPL